MILNKRNPKESTIVLVMILIVSFMLKGYFFLLWTALTISFLTLVSASFTSYTHSIITLVTTFLGKIIQKIILSTVFFSILIPLAFLSRIFGKRDIMKLKKNQTTTFSDCNYKIDKSFFHKMW